MLSLAELARALEGIVRLIQCDPKAFSRFDATPQGFWQSFWAAGLYLPFWILLVVGQTKGPVISSQFLVAMLIGYALGWVLYAYAIIWISDFLKRFQCYYRYMVAYNWFQLAQIIVWIPLAALARSDVLEQQELALLWIAGYLTILYYSWRIARYGLKISPQAAALVVAADFVLSLAIAGLTGYFAGI